MHKVDGKKHFKLYKSGKKWLTAAIVSTGVLVGGAHVAHADSASQLNHQVQAQVSAASGATNANTGSTDKDADQQINVATPKVEQPAKQVVDQPTADATHQTTKNNVAINQVQTETADNGATPSQAPQSNDNNKVTATPKAPASYNGYDWTEQNGNYCWQNQAGQKLTGWQNINNSWYYLGDNGVAKVNAWYQSPAQNWFYFNDLGTALTGWQTINGNLYHFDDQNAWADRGWRKLADNQGQSSWYYFDSSNAWAFRNQWFKTQAGAWYHFDDQGRAATGFQTINGQLYHFDENNSWANTGWQWLTNRHGQSNWYYFDLANTWALRNQWFLSQAGAWYHFNDQGQAATGFQTIDGRGYHFDEANSWANTGWQKINGSWYYYSPTSTWAQPGWQRINNAWYYFDQAGQAQTGRQRLTWGNSTNWYWFDQDNAWMLTGQQTINGGVYSFNGDGSQQLGWQANGTVYYDPNNAGRRASGELKIAGANYYFDPATGQKVTGFTLIQGQNVIKYYDQSGKLMTNHGQYSFDRTTGALKLAGLVDVNGLVSLEGRTFLYDSANNSFKSGWQTVAGKKLYFAPNTGIQVTGWAKIDNSWYYFGTADHQAQTGLSMVNGNYYLFAANGAAQTGWQKLNGSWYYFDDANAWAKKGWFQSGAGNWFYFNPSTAQADTGWQQINGYWYYFDDANAWAKKGWFQSGAGNWFYFDQTNANAKTGWQYINGYWYYFDPTNAWALKGWQQMGSTWYYFDPTNVYMYTGTQYINGKKYTFNNSGAWVDDSWAWPFPSTGRGYFAGAQLFGVNPGGEFRMNGFHDGLDFGSYDHPGSQVHAVHSGKVIQVSYAAGLDWYVVVDTGEYLTVYQEAFSSRNNVNVSVGQTVNVGDVIGTRTTAHLHLGITRQHNWGVAMSNCFNNNGTWLNPLDFL